MGFFESLKQGGRNISNHAGGAGGGLMAVGDMLSQMAIATAGVRPNETAGMAFGRALGEGTQALTAGFDKGREFAREQEFLEFARQQLMAEDLGPRERQLWEATASGNEEYRSLLPALWRAESADAAAAAKAAGSFTPSQAARDRKIMEARNIVNRVRGQNRSIQSRMLADMGVETWSSIVNDARSSLITQPDPEHSYWANLSTQSALYELSNPGGGQAGPTGEGGAAPAPADATLPSEAGPGILDRIGSGVGSITEGVRGFFSDGSAAAPETPDQALRGLLGVGGTPGAPTSPAAEAIQSTPPPAPAQGFTQPRPSQSSSSTVPQRDVGARQRQVVDENYGFGQGLFGVNIPQMFGQMSQTLFGTGADRDAYRAEREGRRARVMAPKLEEDQRRLQEQLARNRSLLNMGTVQMDDPFRVGEEARRDLLYGPSGISNPFDSNYQALQRYGR